MFQSTRPRGARPAIFLFLYLTVPFQSTRPRGARQGKQLFSCHKDLFQSTRPRGARLRQSLQPPCALGFNPRAHVGRDRRFTSSRTGNRFQSTRPRGARHKMPPYLVSTKVSIHAPTWGATDVEVMTAVRAIVSIHAPTWGATLVSERVKAEREFQSTRPRGARHRYYLHSSSEAYVSIHAPTWGATFLCCWLSFCASCFNPRAHVGRDPPTASMALSPTRFQSTRPRGARHVNDQRLCQRHVSIHAPTWGATQTCRQLSGAALVSIHAPTWGATRVCRGRKAPG